MSCLANFMPPLGHCVSAFSIAASSVGAHDRCSWSSFGIVDGSLPSDVAPSSNFASTPATFSVVAPGVMMPSQRAPVFFAVIGPAVATRIGGGVSARVHSRVVWRRK